MSDEETKAAPERKATLGRELLTWLLWKSNSGGAIASLPAEGGKKKRDEGDAIEVLCQGPITLCGIAADTSEVVVKGPAAPYAPITRKAIAEGLLVDQVRLRITVGEKIFEVTLEAEQLAFRSAKLPGLLAEAEDDAMAERLWLIDRLSDAIDAVAAAFIEVRGSATWKSKELPAMRRWIESED